VALVCLEELLLVFFSEAGVKLDPQPHDWFALGLAATTKAERSIEF